MARQTVQLSDSIISDERKLVQTETKRALGIFLLVLVVVFPFIHPRGEQQASRYVATATIWDFGTFEVSDYASLLGRDGAFIDGVAYSDKAPGQPVFAVPAYAVYRLVGGDPPRSNPAATDLGLWWLTVWSAGIPLALLAVLMYKWSSEIEPHTALVATLTITFGSLLIVYGTLLFAHVLAGLFGFAMFLLARNRDASNLRLLAAGFVGGLAVLTEYPLALVVAVVLGASFIVHHRRALWVVLGGIPTLALLAMYNHALFGGPFVFSYQWTVFHGVREQARGTFSAFEGLSLDHVTEVLFSARGLFVATPIVAVGLFGAYLLWRRGSRVDAAVAVLAFLTMLGVQLFWPNSFAGGAGPRYATPGLPFLAAPLAVAWKRSSLWARTLALVSVVTMLFAVLTVPQLASTFDAGLWFWVREASWGHLAPMLYVEWFSGWGWILYALSVGLVLLWLSRSYDRFPQAAFGGSHPR